MTSPSRPSLYTIPVHRAFADALAAGLMARHGGGPLSLASGMVLLPNNRAVTALRDAFIRLAGGALLLPRLVALGDGDLDDRAGGALDRIGDDAEPLPPPIDPVHRRFALARLIGEHRPGVAAAEALRLADGLAQVLDQLAIEDVALSELAMLGQDEPMAEHWEQAFALLRAIAARWPDELALLGMVERTELRNRLLERTAKRWREQGLPVGFVVAAGITTSAPAVARLLRTIAMVPGGTVVLPHCDLGMDAAQWDALGSDPRRALAEDRPVAALETHPQFHLKLLLDRMGLARGEVDVWDHAGEGTLDGPESRVAFSRHLLAPARFTVDWPQVPVTERRLPGVSAMTLANPAEEALAIALALRETLETPGKTAALVTPDRAIAARVSGHLERWGITADDSAGQPLANTPAGDLLLSLIAAAASGFAPVELLALLSHPLVAREAERREWLDRVRELDLLLRGPRPAPGLAAIDEHLRERRADERLVGWWSGVQDGLAPITARLDPRATVMLAPVLASLRETLDLLAGDALWAGAAGRALSAFFEAVERHAVEFVLPIRPDELQGLLRQLMKDVAVRPPQGGHPRLSIWGLIEARLQRADRMILAGLNEGQWPQPPAPDPWLAPMVRRRLGLPGLDRQVGLSAHDFASALSAPEVILTRSQREGTAPTVPSRLRLRIDALMGDKASLDRSASPLAALAGTLDSCDAPRGVARPRPCPSAERRPKRISVTEVDRLLTDPFAFYARAGLGLFALHALDAQPSPAWRGTQVHAVLHLWLIGREQTVPEVERLAAELLARPGVNPLLRTMWAPRLLAPLRWAAQAMLDGRSEGREPMRELSERRGHITIDGVTLSGMPDRIDRMPDGSLAIVDYKTGSGPSKGAVAAGYALQLGLLGAIAEQGGFGGEALPVSRFEYWRMNRGGKAKDFGWVDTPFYKATNGETPLVDAMGFTAFAYARAEAAIEDYLGGTAAFVAKKVPAFAAYADYDQLMRQEEWYGQEGSDEDGHE